MIKMTEKLDSLMDELKKVHSETYYHSLRVKKLAHRMLRRTNRLGITSYNDDEIGWICKGTLLHDIGKLFVDNSLLTKDSSLQANEMDNLRMHTRLGAEAVEGELCGKECEFVFNLCRYHHERIDGGGYEGKKDIPMYVRIVSICDVFDALDSDRVYRKGLSRETIFKMLRENKCGHFDDALIECLEEIVKDID